MRRLTLALLLPLLAGCEPLRGVVSEKETSAPVDISCVDAALRKAFGSIERWDYVSDGGTFPDGTRVAQFAYYRSADAAGRATLHVATVDGATRLAHKFTGVGAALPQPVFPPALAAMRRAGQVLRAACGLDLAGMTLRAVGQDVDALD